MNKKFIYLDNAATSFPKPESVYEAVNKAMRESSGNPIRSHHQLSISASMIVKEARMLCAKLFNAPSPDNIIFTNNATTALNMAIKGVVSQGDHIIASSLEHNSVIRPLKHLEKQRIENTRMYTNINTGFTLSDIKAALQPNTKLVICTHISNVTGTVNDIAAIGKFCRERDILFLVDAAQSAGTFPIDVQDANIDLLAFPGHKGLLGPQGTGGLYIEPNLHLKTILEGGTGSDSISLLQPELLPERLESGTPNIPGLAGLAAGIRFILETGVSKIQSHENLLTQRLIKGIHHIQGIKLVGPDLTDSTSQNIICNPRGSIVSIRFHKIPAMDAALMLDASFGIGVRSGLHCAADAHHTIGTLNTGGTIRISPNYFNTIEDIDSCLKALEHCSNINGVLN